MIQEPKKLDLEKQGYRLVGNHSAIKVCEWTKKCIRGKDYCYKQQFYNIKSHQCIQMTPALGFCNHRCIWCWRDIDFTKPRWSGKIDDPKEIVDGCIKEHIKYLHGFGGNKNVDKDLLKQAQNPKHFAISLSGEPTFYPKLSELIKEIKNRDMTAYLVTNGTNPSMLKKLIKHQPTNLYITLPAPDKETYKKVCSPLKKNAWENIMKSLNLLKKFNCTKVIRLTLTKDENLLNPERYAALLEHIDFNFLECKAYVWVGHSQKRLNIKNMPRHPEIQEFAEQLCLASTNLNIKDEKQESRVVLIEKQG